MIRASTPILERIIDNYYFDDKASSCNYCRKLHSCDFYIKLFNWCCTKYNIFLEMVF